MTFLVLYQFSADSLAFLPNKADSISIDLGLGLLREIGRHSYLRERYISFFSAENVKLAITQLKDLKPIKEEVRKLEGSNYGFHSYGFLDLIFGFIEETYVAY